VFDGPRLQLDVSHVEKANMVRLLQFFYILGCSKDVYWKAQSGAVSEAFLKLVIECFGIGFAAFYHHGSVWGEVTH
jgi:hypothetical protein